MSSASVTRNDSELGGEELSEDEIFDLLSNRRRRFVIHILKRVEGPIEISKLSTRVTAWELKIDPEEVTYEDRRSVYGTLQRTHLPKLEEKNVIHVDKEENVVKSTTVLKNLEIYTEVLESKEIPWSLYYIGLAGVAVTLLLAVVTNSSIAVLSPLEVSVFTATAFAVSAVVHYVIGQRYRLGSTEKPPEVRKIE